MFLFLFSFLQKELNQLNKETSILLLYFLQIEKQEKWILLTVVCIQRDWYAWRLGLDKIWFEGISFSFTKRTTNTGYSTFTNNKNTASILWRILKSNYTFKTYYSYIFFFVIFSSLNFPKITIHLNLKRSISNVELKFR